MSDEALLDERIDNCLLVISATAISKTEDSDLQYGIAYMNISSGRFVLSEVTGIEALYTEIERIKPAELLINDNLVEVETKLDNPAIHKRPFLEF